MLNRCAEAACSFAPATNYLLCTRLFISYFFYATLAKNNKKTRWGEALKKAPNISPKIREWLQRYLPAELLGMFTAFLGFHIAAEFSSNISVAACAAALTENVGFYGLMVYREYRTHHQQRLAHNQVFKWGDFPRVISDIFIEFGFSGIVDSFFIRPLTMAFAISAIGTNCGVIAGKLLADCFFYIPAICLYELKKRRTQTL